jgi:microcystin-dependent protein
MADPFLAEIRIFSCDFPPKGWAFCNGQFLPINQNQALFALLGTNYGGNGQTTFALPNLRGRVPIHTNGSGGGLGESAGESSHTLSVQEMATHTHGLSVRDAEPGVLNGNIGNNTKVFAQGLAIIGSGNQPVNLYGSGPPAQTMNSSSTTTSGGGQAHNNMMPYLVLNFCIALQGIFPSQN